MPEDYKYTHQPEISIYLYAGDLLLIHAEHALKITLERRIRRQRDYFQVKPQGTIHHYPEFSTLSGQTLTLDRVYPKLNGVNCGIFDTNLGLIMFSGWNGLNLNTKNYESGVKMAISIFCIVGGNLKDIFIQDYEKQKSRLTTTIKVHLLKIGKRTKRGNFVHYCQNKIQ